MTHTRRKVAAPSFIVEELQLGLELPSEPEPVAEVHVPSLAVRELLALDPRLIPALPLPTTLLCRREDGGGLVVITTSRAAYEAARGAGTAVFAGGELQSMVLAAENERGTPAELARWCESKATTPGWRLSADVALSGVHPDPRAPRWPLGHVLWTLELELLDVGCGDELLGVPHAA